MRVYVVLTRQAVRKNQDSSPPVTMIEPDSAGKDWAQRLRWRWSNPTVRASPTARTSGVPQSPLAWPRGWVGVKGRGGQTYLDNYPCVNSSFKPEKSGLDKSYFVYGLVTISITSVTGHRPPGLIEMSQVSPRVLPEKKLRYRVDFFFKDPRPSTDRPFGICEYITIYRNLWYCLSTSFGSIFSSSTSLKALFSLSRTSWLNDCRIVLP